MILFSAEAIFASSTSKIRHWNTANRWRRSQKNIHWINQLHFFDPMYSFRRKLRTSTYLSLESYLPASKGCWVSEFVEMKIWDLQSLVVCPLILCRISLTGDDWIFGWRSGLASLIFNWCLILTLPRRWWVNLFWQMGTPWIQVLRIRSWRRSLWICKNVSRYTKCVPNAWRSFSAARRYEGRPQQSFWYRMWWEKHWSTGNVGISTANWFSVLKVLRIVHSIYFILQFLYLASQFQEKILIFDKSSSRNGVEGRTLKLFLTLPFHWDFCDELHVIPNFAVIIVLEEVVDLVAEVLQLERNEVLLAEIQ